ncbi:MAG: glycosyltransferase family 2 protein [Candidatus Omnitrophica bacterium]|nr:glycosyltransferase family 2 protein [Candidatus Omnitrophota bacterium]
MTVNPTYSVLVPAFNEAQTIHEVVDAIRSQHPDFEVIVIDDASTDSTGDLAEEAGANVIRRKTNQGYGAALKEGLRQAKGEFVLFMDADGQHRAEELSKLIEEIEGADMVVGSRPKEILVRSRSWGKKFLAWIANYLSRQEIPDLNSGFRILRKEAALSYLPILPNGFSLTTTITLAMLKDGREVRYVPIEGSPRKGGESQVRMVRDGMGTLLMILRVIMLFDPLRVFTPIALVQIVLGVLYTLYTVVSDTNITETSPMLLLSGFGFLFFGLLADQVSNLRRGG